MIDADPSHRCRLIFLFDPLDRHHHSKLLREAGQRFDHPDTIPLRVLRSGDERLIELDDIDLGLAQERPPGISGAEVVKRNADAALTKSSHEANRRGDLIERDRFADLDAKRPRFEPGLGQNPIDIFEQQRIANLTR